MKASLLFLLVLTGCTGTFRGNFLEIEELTLEPAWAAQGKKTIVRESVTQDDIK